MIVCNEYEDGTRDLGHFGFNRDDCQFAFIANEKGPVKVARGHQAEDRPRQRPLSQTLFYEIDGDSWRWDGAEHGHLGHPMIGMERGREGRCTRVGETRKLKSYAWANFFADERIDPFVIEAP